VPSSSLNSRKKSKFFSCICDLIARDCLKTHHHYISQKFAGVPVLQSIPKTHSEICSLTIALTLTPVVLSGNISHIDFIMLSLLPYVIILSNANNKPKLPKIIVIETYQKLC